MPRFLITRTVPPSKEEELAAAGKRSTAVCEEMGIKWIKSYYSAKDGKPVWGPHHVGCLSLWALPFAYEGVPMRPHAAPQ